MTQQAVNNGEAASRASQKTLHDLLGETLEHFTSLNYSGYSLRSLRFNVLSFLRWLEKTQQVTTAPELKKEHLYRYQKHLAQRRTAKGLPLKPRSINKKIENIRVYLKFLANKGYIMEKLLESINYVKQPQLLPAGILEDAEVRKLLRSIKLDSPEGRRDRAIMELLYSSGLRAGELVKLDLADIDFNHGTVRVMGKGKKERIVPVGESALRQLHTWVIAVRPFLLKAGPKKALFLNYSGKRLKYHTLLRIVHQHCDKLELKENIACHAFRRSFTTELLRGGANIYHVKEMLGHESLQTLKHYTKLTVTDLKKTHQKCHPREKGC